MDEPSPENKEKPLNNSTPDTPGVGQKDPEPGKQAAKKKTKKKRNPLVTLIKVLFVLILFAALAAFSVVCFAYYSVYSNADPITYLDIKPNQYVTYLYAQGAVLDKLHGEENREYASIEEIPEHLANAVIAIEDRRFYQHDGVDIKAILRAVYVNYQSNSFAEGASTITQQLVKNNLLKDTSVTIQRKMEEQCAAYKLEKELASKFGGKEGAKKYILEQYLNSVNLAHGLNGVKTAAKYYFGKELNELTLSECAVIAAIIKNPVRYSPVNSAQSNEERAQTILLNMLELEMINYKQYMDAIEDDVYARVRIPEDYLENEASSSHTYFVDQVIIDVAQDLMAQRGMSEVAAYDLVYSGGLSIYTTFNPQIQAIIDEAYMDESLFPKSGVKQHAYLTFHTDNGVIRRDAMQNSSEEADAYFIAVHEQLVQEGHTIYEESMQKIIQPQSSFVLMDYKTGEVLAIAGGRGGKQYDLAFNRATQARRHPGSCFKVLAAYAPALDTGVITANSVLLDAPYTVGDYTPQNYDFRHRGNTSVRVAIRDSINVLAVKTLVETGYDTSFEYLKRFGFTTLIESEERGGKIYTDKIPSLALGGVTDGVTMLELAAAYGAIANNGQYNKPVFYTKVIGHDGNILLENTLAPQLVLQPKTAYILTDMMKDVISSGTGTQARFRNLNMPVAGKTGTSTNDKDLTFAGYTPYYVASVWLGYDTPQALQYNQNYHLSLWRVIMERVHLELGLPYADFERPEGITDGELGRIYRGTQPVLNTQNTTPDTSADGEPEENEENESTTPQGESNSSEGETLQGDASPPDPYPPVSEEEPPVPGNTQPPAADPPPPEPESTPEPIPEPTPEPPPTPAVPSPPAPDRDIPGFDLPY